MTVDRAASLERIPFDATVATFVVDHYDRLLRLARLVCRDASDAADAVQVGLELAWRQRASLRDPNSLRPWLDRIVVREAIRVGRSRSSWLARLVAPRPGVIEIDPIDRGASEPASFVALRAAFRTLSPEQRAVVALHLHEGYSVAETASIVGAPVETVRSRLRLARSRLRLELEEIRS